MAIPLVPNATDRETLPKTVLGAKVVNLALVTFTDSSNMTHTTLVVIGENNVHLLEGRELGFSKNTTPKGQAAEWLRNAIFEKLGMEPTDKKEG